MSVILKGEYESFAEFDEDFKHYCAATFQTYIKRRSNKIQRPHAKKEDLQYIKLVYKCVHHSKNISEATGKRQFLHSRKKGCDAEIRVNAQLRRGVLEVQKRDEVHNHALEEHIWKHLPENRRLSKEEKGKVTSLVESHVPTVAIKTQLRKESQKVVTTKDVANIRQKAERTERGGRSEVETIDHVLVEYRKKDPKLFVDIATSASGWSVSSAH